ncbi:MAG: hypothetical protein WED12_04720 [Chloroflexota bacterium]
MSNARRLLATLVLPAVILLGFVASAAAGGNAGKVDVCHFSNRYHMINVSVNALPAHLRHGDVLPDEYGDCP